MRHIWIGVDPGSTGAVATLHSDGTALVFDFADRSALRELQHLATLAFCSPGETIMTAMVEKVASMPGQGVRSTFTFGTAYGIVLGWLDALYIPYQFVAPAKWRRGVCDSGAKTADIKAGNLDLARRLFPTLQNRLTRKKDHNRADALLIAEYARRMGLSYNTKE